MDAGNNMVYVTLAASNAFVTIPVVSCTLVPSDLEVVSNTEGIAMSPGNNCGIVKDGLGVVIADYFRQRVVRFTDNLVPVEYFGSHGNGEGEFLKPSLVESCENRLFIYDESRYDVQVFTHDFKPIVTLRYNTDPESNNYIEPDFMLNISDLKAVTREEGNLLYYYVLLLSLSLIHI